MARHAGRSGTPPPRPEGVRIAAREELRFADGAMVAVTDHARPYPAPKDGRKLEDVQAVCAICGVQHFAKTYHIQLRAGSAIVSDSVWRALEGLADNPFVLMNTVSEPPAQSIAPNNKAGAELIEKFPMPITTTKRKKK